MVENEIMLEESARIHRLDKSNAEFFIKNGFLAMTYKDSDGEKTYDRVFLHRAFPFELLWKYISVISDDGKEKGVIFDIEDFSEDMSALIKTELERKYYSSTIKSINSLKERYGFSYWRVTLTDGRNVNFTMQDTFRNIIRLGDYGAILLDVDGNRFVIKSISSLDRRSYRRIELYL
ncbi:MAG: DUF1854 domain-containing protein [Clostridia bacterium]|nr:DUF1854 domain-containing protein [Clostridia bacterium]